MATWAALNVAERGPSHVAQEEATEEARDADNTAMYEQALRYQQRHETARATALYVHLLERDVRLTRRLEYLCHKNLATMALEAQSFEHALDSFASALALDATDVVVWYQMGTTAIETGKWWLARRTLEEGLKVDATYWPLVETLAQVLYQVGDHDAYEHVAHYLRRHDPQCASVHVIDHVLSNTTSQRVSHLSAREKKLRERAHTKLHHFQEIQARETRRRRALERRRTQSFPLKRYTLDQHTSWMALGELLLEAFEDIHVDDKAHVLQTPVEMDVAAFQDVEDLAQDKVESGLEASDDVPPLKRVKLKESTKGSEQAARVSDLVDHDTRLLLHEMMPRRRKSRRHEERLREEHAAAVKKAQEENLTYRLRAFLPENGTTQAGENKQHVPSSIGTDWPAPLKVKLVETAFCVSNAKNETIVTTRSFDGVTSSGNVAAKDKPSSSRRSFSDETANATASPVAGVTTRQVRAFVDSVGANRRTPRRIHDWIREYLNQCGQWSHMKLGREGEEIHKVCLWLEKAFGRDLERAHSVPSTRSCVVHVPDHVLAPNSRFEGNGLSLGTQVFLFELQFDLLVQKTARTSPHTMKRVVESQLTQAQKLLFEFGWLEDAENASCRPLKREFVRLLWLIARMHEQSGDPQLAQHFFIKCRDKMIQFKTEDRECSERVYLPNQSVENEITLDILDEKIAGLRFSDVCAEARGFFEAQDYDRVVSVLLSYFFPRNQAARITDFLNDFEGDDTDVPERRESNRLIDLMLQSLHQSSHFSTDDSILFLLTLLYHVIDFVDALAGTNESTSTKTSAGETCAGALAAVDYLLRQLTQDTSEYRTKRMEHQVLLRALCVRCLHPSILFRFESPNEVFSRLCLVFTVGNDGRDGQCDHRQLPLVGVEATARLLYVIRSLSSEESSHLLTMASHASKRKQPRRDRIRAMVLELLRFLNRSFRADNKLVLSLSQSQQSALMVICSTLMKEEEETVGRSDVKTATQLYGNGAILFLHLYEGWGRLASTTSSRQLVKLIHFLHERLGRYGICGLTYCSPGDGSCFLETSVVVLSNCGLAPASRFMTTEDDMRLEEDETNVQDLYQKEMCQCYRCLYDVQIVPGCDDHKTGTTFASLVHADARTKQEDARRLMRFAVPILLATMAKTNGQKKERLKLLYAVRDALAESNVAPLSVHVSRASPALEAYLAPQGLLQEQVEVPVPCTGGHVASSSVDDVCLGHLWYLLGADYILGRVKRRGNVTELMDMEQQVRERVEFLRNDVIYYHPDRIDSWIRLGETMKELYHAATDAFAAILGRKRRIRALQWYASTIESNNANAGFQDPTHLDSLFFDNVVLQWNLFQKIKAWLDREKEGGTTASVSMDLADETMETNKRVAPRGPDVPIEEYAWMCIAQVIEFARRCFDMAARLAEEAGKRVDDQREMAGDRELDELQHKRIECKEECGLLLYTVLQELSLMKEQPQFPLAMYARLVAQTLAYFQQAWEHCASHGAAQEVHFRLHYMIGKTLKKRRWCQLREQETSTTEALAIANDMAACFSRAESARKEGDREHVLVHAFYSLQALRAELTTSASPSVPALRLVCSHFYEEEKDIAVEREEIGDEDGTSHSETGSLLLDVDRFKPSDMKATSSAKKEEILTLLTAAESHASSREVNVLLARGWLMLNIIEALESIPNEDRYFHPSRYLLARIVYWLLRFCSMLGQRGDQNDRITAFLEAVRTHGRESKPEGPSVGATRALQAMAPIFDKKRPQIVAIWFSEYIPSAKKFEELNQRQIKYDYYRLKYWRFYTALLQENGAYGRLKEVMSWVLACKEEHDVIDMMLGIVLKARGNVLRARLRHVIDALNVDTSLEPQGQGDPHGQDGKLMKQLAKTYAFYLEVLHAQQRLVHVMDDWSMVLEHAELPMVAVFFLGVLKFPTQMQLMEKHGAIVDEMFATNVTAITNALRRDELPPRIYNAHGQDVWSTYRSAVCCFCEAKWPERVGKGKAHKKGARLKSMMVECGQGC
ncbi:hypothetical protein PsorP6_017168 [Peronosclerospora sorghi]|uniref:Uncharacterized protein n=1 Tax=Peronosclerospora sorghi TaxID=230839 RepID=A0ACC0WCB7_9STRA|nr:hypothetical protein PsorP6_017168 [Peronosclerospora sorghi]